MKLEVRNVTKVYESNSKERTVQALNGVSFSVEEGSILGIVGESGCGKSTLSRIVAGLEEPTSGEVLISGLPRKGIAKFIRKSSKRPIQLVFQDPYSSLNPRQTVYHAIEEVVKIYDHELDAADTQTRIFELLSSVGIGKDLSHRYPHQFSGGQRQRICIARSLAAKPEILVLDEPVSALDVSVSADIINLLLDLQREFNLTYIFVSHDLGIVKHVSDTIIVMLAGEIVEFGSWTQVMDSPKHEYTKRLIAAIPSLEKLKIKETGA